MYFYYTSQIPRQNVRQRHTYTLTKIRFGCLSYVRCMHTQEKRVTSLIYLEVSTRDFHMTVMSVLSVYTTKRRGKIFQASSFYQQHAKIQYTHLNSCFFRSFETEAVSLKLRKMFERVSIFMSHLKFLLLHFLYLMREKKSPQKRLNFFIQLKGYKKSIFHPRKLRKKSLLLTLFLYTSAHLIINRSMCVYLYNDYILLGYVHVRMFCEWIDRKKTPQLVVHMNVSLW